MSVLMGVVFIVLVFVITNGIQSAAKAGMRPTESDKKDSLKTSDSSMDPLMMGMIVGTMLETSSQEDPDRTWFEDNTTSTDASDYTSGDMSGTDSSYDSSGGFDSSSGYDSSGSSDSF